MEIKLKKYSSILRYGKKETFDAIKGDIIIWEKLDGANASFSIYDKELYSFSRRTLLTETETLHGFYNYVQDEIKNKELNSNYIYFGEWLIPHKIKYKTEYIRKFYLFDIFDKETNKYLSYDIVKQESERLNLNLAPIHYIGPFISLEHINEFVGKSFLSIDGEGEGVVIKNTEYQDEFGNQVFVKIVTEKFKEVKHRTKSTNVHSHDALTEFIDNVVTENRVEKIISKLQEDNLLPEELDISDMGLILKSIGNKVVEDVMKEEFDELQKIINKKIAKKVPSVIKDLLNKEDE